MVPDAVMDELEIPLALAGFEIYRDQTFAEEVIAGTRSAIEVARGLLDADIDESSPFVDRDLSPGACVAGVGPGIIQPCIESKLARLRNGVEDPLTLARADIVSADISFDIGFTGGHAARLVSGAHHDGVPADRRRRMNADLAAERIDYLIVIRFEIDGAIHAEARNAEAGPGVQRDHAISLREVDDALVVAARGAARPVREAAAGQTPGRNLSA